jgi:hypothetical protein
MKWTQNSLSLYEALLKVPISRNNQQSYSPPEESGRQSRTFQMSLSYLCKYRSNGTDTVDAPLAKVSPRQINATDILPWMDTLSSWLVGDCRACRVPWSAAAEPACGQVRGVWPVC